MYSIIFFSSDNTFFITLTLQIKKWKQTWLCNIPKLGYGYSQCVNSGLCVSGFSLLSIVLGSAKLPQKSVPLGESVSLESQLFLQSYTFLPPTYCHICLQRLLYEKSGQITYKDRELALQTLWTTDGDFVEK